MKPFAAATFTINARGRASRTVRVRVEAPRRSQKDVWTSRVAITGLLKPTRVHGGDPIQALCLALELIGNTLYAQRRRGLRLRFLTGEEVPLHAYFRLREWRRRLVAIARSRGPQRRVRQPG
jgi:hypothetical protein